MTFYFYDLETSGINSRYQRIMQFGGQRTDENLNPIGEPFQTLVKLSDDTLPEPDAVMVTGITPQETIADGISEVALINHLNKDIFTPGTIVAGFNNLRFDDEFIRNLLYRNYFDPYEREWSDDRGRWDVIDLVRMTRALRPEGIQWPKTEDGGSTNKLEKLTEANGIEHDNAHDALADVRATIEVARLIKKAQPKLYEHLLSMRDKKKVADVLSLGSGQPIVHSSGMLKSEHLSTSAFLPLVAHPTNNNAILCWDLRYDPKPWAKSTSDEIARLAFSSWQELSKTDELRIPIKAIHLNRCPAVAPIGVLDKKSQDRIGLTLAQIESHLEAVKKINDLPLRLAKAWKGQAMPTGEDVEGQIYDGFIPDTDKHLMKEVHQLSEVELQDYTPRFTDERLNHMWIRYKARNFPKTMSDGDRSHWEQHRANKLKSGPGMTLTKYMNRLKALAEENPNDKQKIFLLEELQLYAESIMPYENTTLV